MSHPGPMVGNVRNLWTPQYAGPRDSISIESYISGYFDGEGCFSVAIGPRPGISGRLGSTPKCFGQLER